jgi:hypothetical protein
MAFTITHTAEFTDRLGTDWKVDILKDVAQGAIATLQVTGDPLHIEWLAASDDLLASPIKGSTATLNLECVTNFQYIGFYNSEEMVYKMKVYKATVLYWQGWLSTDYTEPYDPVPYTVALTAADGLGMLRDIEYKNAGADYEGRDEERDILLAILGKIGYTQFTEFVNLYEDRMTVAVGDSPCTQLFIERLALKDLNCYEALEEILKKYNAVIRQAAGEFVIYRPTELVGDTVLGRVITSGATVATSITPDQFLARTGTASNIVDVLGGVLMMTPPLSQFTAEQDYGNKESWVLNHNCEETVGASYPDNFAHWTLNGSIRPLHYETLLSKETEGMEFLPDGTGDIFTAYQDFGVYAKATADMMVFSFEYRLIKETAGAAVNVVFKLKINSLMDDYWLADDSDVAAHWAASLNFIGDTIASVPQGIGSWTTMTYNIATGLPVGGLYRITLYATDTAGVRIAWKGLRFYSTCDTLVSKTKRVSRWKKWVNMIPPFGIIRFFGGGYKKVKDTYIEDNEEVVSRSYSSPDPATIEGGTAEQNYLLGDCEDTGIVNVLEQFNGALSVYAAAGGLTATAAQFVIDNTVNYAGGGVVLTSSGAALIFTSDTAGVDFTGASTCVNDTGDLAGAVVATQANVTAVARIDHVNVPNIAQDYFVTCDNVRLLMVWDTNLATTITTFVAAYGADYTRLTVDNFATYIKFTANTPGVNFIGATTLTDDSNVTAGSITYSTANRTAVARKDTITLSGTGGTAIVTVDAEVQTASWVGTSGQEYTTSWHTRGGAEAQPIIELIADEMAALYSKGRQFLQLSLEEDTAATTFNMVGNLQDPLNVIGANNRVFVPNRGSLDVRNRSWTVDVMEIGDKLAAVPFDLGGYYVAPDGDDGDDGSFETPWATWEKAFNTAVAGDTVYFRGGTYYMGAAEGTGYTLDTIGTLADPVIFSAYPGEVPILDGVNITSGGGPYGIVVYEAEYIQLNGLHVRNIPQLGTGDSTTIGIAITSSYEIRLTDCKVYNTGGSGFKVSGGSEIYFDDCDAYNNVDTLTAVLPGNDGYGFNIYSLNTDSTVYYSNCRAWLNGDDGFSGVNEGVSTYNACWAFYNGQLDGEGNGFKIGWLENDLTNLRRVMTNCLAVYNRARGIDTNEDITTYCAGMHIYNNTVYANGWGGSWPGVCIFNTGASDGTELLRIFRNNISGASTDDDLFLGAGASYTHSNNSWDIPLTVNAADFIDLPNDEDDCLAILSVSRQSDGSLPDIGDYFKLITGSDCIHAGVAVGLTLDGEGKAWDNPPSVGAFEYE